jgi:DNA-binding GntR family transcriptional regulator
MMSLENTKKHTDDVGRFISSDEYFRSALADISGHVFVASFLQLRYSRRREVYHVGSTIYITNLTTTLWKDRQADLKCKIVYSFENVL